MNLRKTALSLLREAESEQKYISLSLDGALNSMSLDERDARLLTNLVYGTTEKRTTLDYYIDRLTNEKVGTRMRHILRLGLYQLIYLTKIPHHAAVSQTVLLGKSAGERAFINAVLRNYIRHGETIPLPNAKSELLSVKYSFPLGITELFLKELGEDAENALSALSKTPPMTICNNSLRSTREDIQKKLAAENISSAPCEIAETGIVINQGISYAELCKILGDGTFFVQDEASQLAVKALSPKAGEIGVDVCACPGSKSFLAALRMENTGTLYSFDIHESKLPLIQKGADRLGISIIHPDVHDAASPVESLVGKCDFVICDVPCTGLGVLAKKPEIRYHSPSLCNELAPLGQKILSASSKYLKVGGRLLFSTCTLTKCENQDTFYGFLKTAPSFAPMDFTIGELKSDNGCLTLLPNGVRDGFFISLMKKEKP